MSLLRYNAKRDRNELEIIAALEKLGVWVMPISAAGLPDLLCAWKGRLTWIEVKSKTGRLTKGQRQFADQCLKKNVPYYLVSELEELEWLRWLL